MALGDGGRNRAVCRTYAAARDFQSRTFEWRQLTTGTMSKFFSWHVWAAAAIAVAAVLMTIFDPSPLILIAIFFALCVYIVVEIRKRKLS